MRKEAVVLGIILTLLNAQTLRDAVGITVSSNSSIKAAQFQYQRAVEDYNSAFRRTLPLLNLDSSYKYVSEVSSITMPTLPGQPAKEIELGVHDTYDNGLTLSLLAFNGFAKETQVQIALLKKDISKIQLERMIKDIGYKTASLSIKARSLELQKDLTLAGRQRVEIQYDKVKSSVDNGMALKVDLMSLQLSIDQYDQQLSSVEAALANAKEELNNLAEQILEIPAVKVSASYDPIAELNITENEELRIIDLQKNIINSYKTLAAAKNYPDLSLSASARRGKPGVNPIDNEWMNYSTAGVSLQWNLWDWGARSADVSAQEQEIKALKQQRKIIEDQVIARYNAAARDYQAIIKQCAVLENSVQVARDRMKIYQDQAKNGVVAVSDFLDVDNDLLQIEMKYQQQLLNAYLKEIELDYLSGKNIEQWRLEK